MNPALVISSQDNVATALEPLERGTTIHAGAVTVSVVEAIPRGHKLALRAIVRGDAVVKYGSPIGVASADIAAGAHVHTHNVASTRGRGDLSGASGVPRMTVERVESDPVGRIAEPPDTGA